MLCYPGFDKQSERWHIDRQAICLHKIESISKVFKGNRFHASLRILSPEILLKKNLYQMFQLTSIE